MPLRKTTPVSQAIVTRAQKLGATAAGLVPVAALRQSPSHRAAGSLQWPPEARTVLVMALVHPADDPELDWWDGRPGGTPGNRRLLTIERKLAKWIRRRLGCRLWPLPYSIEKGGKFLKDAAMLAGLGVIGRNNLLVSPKYGPRLRLRAMLLGIDLGQGRFLKFDPCRGCPAPCHQACPQDAFRSGRYHRPFCLRQMARDEAAANRMIDLGVMMVRDRRVRYCRACELACPVAQ
jgi:epoxyqueuosine reductase